jgi:hypothetical protein
VKNYVCPYVQILKHIVFRENELFKLFKYSFQWSLIRVECEQISNTSLMEGGIEAKYAKVTSKLQIQLKSKPNPYYQTPLQTRTNLTSDLEHSEPTLALYRFPLSLTRGTKRKNVNKKRFAYLNNTLSIFMNAIIYCIACIQEPHNRAAVEVAMMVTLLLLLAFIGAWY